MVNKNGKNGKSVLTRRAEQWDKFLDEIISKIEENGFPKRLSKPQVERLILHHKDIHKIKEELVLAFQGLQKVKPEVKKWMHGY